MLSDDFVGAIALDPLGAAVPGGDPALGVEPVNRVIADRVDQQPELPFGLLQFLLQRLARRNIAQTADKGGAAVKRYRGNSQLDREFAAAAMQPRQLDASPEITFLAGIKETTQPAGMGVAMTLRDDQFGHVAADHFVARPAEHLGGTLVPLRDSAVGAHDDDGVERGVQQQIERAFSLRPRAHISGASFKKLRIPLHDDISRTRYLEGSITGGSLHSVTIRKHCVTICIANSGASLRRERHTEPGSKAARSQES